MQIIQPPQLEEVVDCPYLPGRQKQYSYFFAGDVQAAELSDLLARGWRKFGHYFFRPNCPGCRRCIPLRIPAAEFVPSRSQRRVLRKGAALRVEFGPLRLCDRIYEIYRLHSLQRFDHRPEFEEFLFHFYLPSCPVLQTEVYLEDVLVAVGFLDQGDDCLSSVYFCFDPAFQHWNPGTFGVLKEIEETRRLGLPWYHLGYYVPGSPRMAYKDHFRPREHFDWKTGMWRGVEGAPNARRDVTDRIGIEP